MSIGSYLSTDMLKESSEGVLLAIKVIPKSHRDEIIGWENEELKIRLKAVPDKGNANVTIHHPMTGLKRDSKGI